MLSVALLLAVPLVAGAQQPARIAVIPFHASSVTLEDVSAIGVGLTDMMITELSGRPNVRVVERQEVESVMRAHKLALSGGGDEEVALEVGRLVGAQYIVLGSVMLVSKQARLDMRILDVETSEVHRTGKRQDDRDELLAMVEGLAAEFTQGLRLPERVVVAEVPVAASVAYSRGLDYARRGMRERAVAMYRRVLDLFPAHEGAKRALEALDEGGDR